MERHFRDLLQRYRETVAVDLTDKVRVSSLLSFPQNKHITFFVNLQDLATKMYSQLFPLTFICQDPEQIDQNVPEKQKEFPYLCPKHASFKVFFK